MLCLPLTAPSRATQPETPTRILPHDIGPPTSLHRGLAGLVVVLRWASRFATIAPYARDLIESVDELLRLLKDARRAADTHAQLDHVLRKIDAVERRLGASSNPSDTRLGQVLRRMQTEIETSRRSRYRTCGENMYRGPDGCVDKRNGNTLK